MIAMIHASDPSIETINGGILQITAILLGIVGGAAALAFLRAGYLWLRGGDNAQHASEARRSFEQTVIGVIVCVSAFTLSALLQTAVVNDAGFDPNKTLLQVTPVGTATVSVDAVTTVAPKPTPTATSTNLVKNPSFDDVGGWECSSGAIYSLESPHSGSYSLSIAPKANESFRGCKQRVNLSTEGQYTLTVWLKGKGGSFAIAGTKFTAVDTHGAYEEWSIEISSKAGEVTITLQGSPLEKEWIYFDDIALKKIS